MEGSPDDVGSARWRRRAELALLRDEVAKAAQVNENGEVAWPNESADAAIRALAAAGFLILGLDAHEHVRGGIVETPISDYSPGVFFTEGRGLYRGEAPRVEPTPEARRDAALADLPTAAEHGDFVLITYSGPNDPVDSKF